MLLQDNNPVALLNIRDLLLKLPINEQDQRITELYFELARRSSAVDFWLNESAAIFNQTLENKPESAKLIVDEQDYKEIASYLGIIATNDLKQDSNNYNCKLIPRAFLYLQQRARNGNRFSFDEKINKIEATIAQSLAKEDTKSDVNMSDDHLGATRK